MVPVGKGNPRQTFQFVFRRKGGKKGQPQSRPAKIQERKERKGGRGSLFSKKGGGGGQDRRLVCKRGEDQNRRKSTSSGKEGGGGKIQSKTSFCLRGEREKEKLVPSKERRCWEKSKKGKKRGRKRGAHLTSVPHKKGKGTDNSASPHWVSAGEGEEGGGGGGSRFFPPGKRKRGDN